MTTIRVAKRHRFTSIDRRPINDKRLSYKARGVLIWLLDKPDGWVVNGEAMARQSIDGKYAVRTALQELETLGYLRRGRDRNENGQWVNVSEVFEVPTVSDDAATNHQGELLDGVQLPDAGLPDAGKPDFKNKEQTDVATTSAAADLAENGDVGPMDEPENEDGQDKDGVAPMSEETRAMLRETLAGAKPWVPPVTTNG